MKGGNLSNKMVDAWPIKINICLKVSNVG